MLSIVALLPVLALSGGEAAAIGEGGSERRVILFGARWCAPCMAEYRNLPALIAAAVPDRLALAWVDRPIAPPPALAGQVDGLPLDEARREAERHGGVGYGLPLAVMVDSQGRACALRRSGLRPADLPEMRRQCRDAARSATGTPSRR